MPFVKNLPDHQATIVARGIASLLIIAEFSDAKNRGFRHLSPIRGF